MRLAGRGTGLAFSLLRRVTGVDFLEDLSGFFRSFGGMLDGFRERAKQVDALLTDPATTFLLVTSPEREPIDEAIYFWRKLRAAPMPFGGVVVNRTHPKLTDADARQAGEHLVPALGADLAGRVAENLGEYQVLSRRDAVNLEHLTGTLDVERLITIPHFDEDVHDAAGLAYMQRYLFAETSAASSSTESATPHRSESR